MNAATALTGETRKVVALAELTERELDAWHTVHTTDARFDSAFFHPGFAQAIQASGRDVSVLVLGDAEGEIRGLLPFHRERSRMVPLGWPGADFQSVLLVGDTTVAPLELLSPGLKSFTFDHLLDVGDGFAPWISARRVSPYLDATGGLDGYLARASKSGRQNMAQARRRSAKAERDIGPVRFEADVVDDALLDRVIELKRGQYTATGVRDHFADPRRVALLHRLLHTRDVGFGGILSGLYAGDRLVAAHFGMRAGAVLHWWFPVYDPEFATLAPGWMLLRELVSAAPELGVTRIDFGRGEDDYKRRAKTGETIVCEGFISSSPARVTARNAKIRAITAAKESALGPRLRAVVAGWRTRGDRS